MKQLIIAAALRVFLPTVALELFRLSFAVNSSVPSKRILLLNYQRRTGWSAIFGFPPVLRCSLA